MTEILTSENIDLKHFSVLLNAVKPTIFTELSRGNYINLNFEKVDLNHNLFIAFFKFCNLYSKIYIDYKKRENNLELLFLFL